MNKFIKTLFISGAACMISASIQAGPAIDTDKLIKPTVRSPMTVKQQVSIPARPDLAASLSISNIHRNSDGSYRFDLNAHVMNRGTGKYLSQPNQQSLGLFESAGQHSLRQAAFGNLNPGQRFSITQRIAHYWPSAEFFTGYQVSLTFDPDIRSDNNSNNDDNNPRNNSATLSQDQLNHLLGV
jgi:hypothetical protein